MAAMALPDCSRPLVVAAGVGLVSALLFTCCHDGRSWIAAATAFLLSAFLADLFTAVAHFCFDYVFPEQMPIFGPIAAEFRQHHAGPTLDPSAYFVNLTKGAYCSLPLSVLIIGLLNVFPTGSLWFFILSTLLGIAFWGLFFHQIHSYAHMGSSLSPEEFTARVTEISALPDRKRQKQEFEHLFATMPIPPAIRALQKMRILLNPRSHNVHHVRFESDFSSVNGWSDPISNLVLGPLARRFKTGRQT